MEERCGERERGHSCPRQSRGKCRTSLPGVFPNLSPEVVILIHTEGRRSEEVRKEGRKGGWRLIDPSEVGRVGMSDDGISSRVD